MPDPAPDPQRDDLLRTFLADRDTPCPCCHYNLRGLQTSTCPECNQPLHLAVNLSEPRLGPYLAALCGLLAGIGSGTVLISTLLFLIIFTRGRPSARELGVFVGIPSISVVFLLILLTILLRRSNRVWFRTAPPGQRTLAILGCWLATAACVAWFLWTAIKH